MSGKGQLEAGLKLSLDFEKISQVAQSGESVIPVVVQDFESRDVLILGYTNREAFEKSMSSKMVTFWSTSRNELWVKGATSGSTLRIVDIFVNCEQNSLLYLVTAEGKGACHTKGPDGNFRTGCFYRRVDGNTLSLEE
ncbi:MAG: phosphoribosyl-AMP cyclohydrolase [Candidatus Marinamargulisbacteria bacterium]|jgi:phosphoribosyl-AMP cyclohydrolase